MSSSLTKLQFHCWPQHVVRVLRIARCPKFCSRLRSVSWQRWNMFSYVLFSDQVQNAPSLQHRNLLDNRENFFAKSSAIFLDQVCLINCNSGVSEFVSDVIPLALGYLLPVNVHSSVVTLELLEGRREKSRGVCKDHSLKLPGENPRYLHARCVCVRECCTCCCFWTKPKNDCTLNKIKT